MANLQHGKAGRKLPRVDELDGLRGILASWVAVTHILGLCGFVDIAVPRPLASAWHEFIIAPPAVDVFMILSGFAISFMLHARKESYGAFMRGRFFRIYPTFFMCLMLGLGTIHIVPAILDHAPWRDTTYFRLMRSDSVSEQTHPFLHTLCHLTLLNGLLPRSVLFNATGTLLPPAWSISLEWQYYLVAPFIALMVGSGGGLLFLGIIAYFGFQYAGHWANPFSAFLPAQLPLFLIGIGSYYLYACFIQSANGRSARFSIPAAALLAGALLSSWHSTALAIWGVAFGSVFVEGPGLFARLLSGLRRVLLHPWLQYLGKISYPIYLVHWPILLGLLFLLIRIKPSITSGQACLLMFVLATPAVLFVAGLLHKYIEAPFMKLGKGRKREVIEIAPAPVLP